MQPRIMKNKHEAIQNTQANIDYEGLNWQSRPLLYPDRTIRIGTSFSGIGAIEHALNRLGVNTDIKFAGDIDADCKKSYFANYNISEKSWHTDVHEFDAKPYKGEIDLFVGGAPCQAFSMRGKRKGFEDTRGTLFREFARILKECEPKVFIFENVKGILSHDGGHTWEVIKRTFEEYCNYQVYFQVLSGKDYGIPQSRERLFCVGFKQETEFKFPAPISLDKTIFDYLESTIDTKYLLKDKGINFVTRELNHNKSFTQVNGQVALCQKRNQQFNWHGDFVYHPISNECYSERLPIRNLSECETNYFAGEDVGKYAASLFDSSVLSMDSPNSYNPNIGVFRKLTPRECLRLMGFDDTFNIVVPDTAAYKQSGNSIIVNVLIAILRQMDITKYGA